MKIGELRKVLEGAPDEAEFCVWATTMSPVSLAIDKDGEEIWRRTLVQTGVAELRGMEEG